MFGKFALSVQLFSVSLAAAQIATYVDITADSGIVYDGVGPVGCGVAIGDYDNDGWDDVLLMGSSADGNQLFRNHGDGTFSNVTAQVFPEVFPRATSGHFVDLDNDGDQDFAYARWYGSNRNTGYHYMINEDGVFVAGNVADQFAREASRTGGTAVADLDQDGDLDFVLAHYWGKAYCLRNDGIWNFADATADVGGGFAVERRHWSVVLADFNNNGLIDVHAAVDGDRNYHANNQGDGTFIDVSVQAGFYGTGADMGLAVGDIENDGDLDIYSTRIGSHALYVNDGTGTFTEDAAGHGVRRVENGNFASGWGCAFVDIDHDTDLDLMMVTESQRGSVYENDGTGQFTFATSGTGLRLTGWGLAPFDFDRDGDLDLLLTSATSPPVLYRNTTDLPNRNWLVIRPRGVQSNRDGIGARVRVTVGRTTMMREILSGESFYVSTPHVAHFGLGAAETADTVYVRWPSGTTRTIRNVKANRYLKVIEPTTLDGRLVADADSDCDVDLDDLLIQLTHFGSRDALRSDGDTDADADVDLLDLVTLLSQLGAGCF